MENLKSFNYKGLSEASGVDYTKLNRSIAYQSGKALSATDRAKVIIAAEMALKELKSLYLKEDGI
jgi:hypothetical protein